MSVIAKVLDEIAAIRLGRSLIQAVHARGTTDIRRYDIGPANTMLGESRATVNGVFHKRDGPVIEVLDRFFDKNNLRDRSGGYRLQTRIILHELFHAFDDEGRQYSENGRAFMALIDFECDESWKCEPVGFSNADIVSHNAVGEKIKDLQNRREFDSAWSENRAWAMAHSLPSLNSWNRPREAFAEIGAHLLLDPHARSYLNPRVVDYFDTGVFKALKN